jgi:putative glycerol kinase 5
MCKRKINVLKGLFDNYNQLDEILSSVDDSNGVYFVPSFSSVEVDGKDTKSAAAFIGLKPNTTKAHMLRAIFDSIAFSTKEIYESMLKDLQILHIKVNSIR